MAGEPAVRARHLKALLSFADRQPGEVAARVRQRMGPEALRRIADASGIEWLPFELDLDLTRHVHAVLGPDEFVRFFRQQTLAAFEGPLLKTLVDTAVRMFGLDPMSWARWVPMGWSLLFRNCGAWTSETAVPGTVVLRLSGAPAAAAGDPVWPDSVAASLSALVDMARARGRVEAARGPGAIVFTMTWTKGGA